MPTTYAIPDGRTVMAASLYAGAGTTQSVTNTVNGISFKPDFVWLKNRTNVNSNYLFDAVRGVGAYLSSDATAAESTNAQTLTAFNSNGFTLGTAGGGINGSGSNFVGWQWQAGQGTTSSNTSGSITSTVSVNATAGFSVVTYTGNGTANATIGHGLGVAPSMIIVKQRNAGNDWPVYHASLASPNNLWLDFTVAATTYTGRFNNAGFSSSVFSVSNQSEVNGSTNTYVAYCWAAVKGFSAFGSYTGNNSTDGPFVYLGFRPRWLMVKNSTSAQSWQIMDTSRSPYNASTNDLLANSSSAELSGTDYVDFNSNGFKIRQSSAGNWNNSGDTYIYAAFAENPFKYANAR